MSGLAQSWQRLKARYDAMTRRERLLIAAALVIGPSMVVNALFIDPQAIRRKQLSDNIARQTSSLTELQAQVSVLQQQLQQDPNEAKKAELAGLIADREALDRQIREFGAALVPPEEMNALLERLLARQPGLHLLSLKTLPPQSVLSSSKEKPDEKSPRVFDLYRHGVEIRLEGSYRDLQAYLGQLEKLDKRLIWGAMSYRVAEYPRAEMTLTVYTLSPERTWLAI